MDFSEEIEYTEELREFEKEVQQWMEENVPEDLALPEILPRYGEVRSYEQWQKQCEFRRTLGAKGWLFPRLPREYRGGGLRRDHAVVIERELTKKNTSPVSLQSPGGSLAVPVILAFGTEEQKKRFLPPMIRGEVYTYESFTEPEAGTDLAGQQTNALRAVREKEWFIINGQKMFSSGHYPPPDQFLLLTRSDLEAPKHENLAMFVCPADLPGISITPLDLFIPFATNQIFFEDVRLHESFLIGGDHDGWKMANAALAAEHGAGRGSKKEGRRDKRNACIPRNIVADRLFAQCKNNPNIARRLRENPHLLDTLVDIYIGAQIERLFRIRSHGGKAGPYGGPQEFLYSKVFTAKLAAGTQEILGPYALVDNTEWCLDEGIIERGQRQAIAAAPGGTPESLKIIIARALDIGR